MRIKQIALFKDFTHVLIQEFRWQYGKRKHF